MFRNAPAPTRSSNSFTIGFGLLNIPVSVYTGTEETQVKRSEFTVAENGEMHAVGRVAYDKVTNAVIEDPNTAVGRYAQDEATGKWVLLTDEEIAACTMPKGVAEIVAFVPLANLHKAYLTIGMAQVRAKTSGMKEAQKGLAQRTFGLLLAGLRERKVAALVKVALRGPARFAAITPEGDLLWLIASDGIRQSKDLGVNTYTEQEMALVGNLIDAIGKGTPVITDDTADKVRAYVATKAAQDGMTVPVAEAEAPLQDDLFAALSASIDMAKASKAGAA